LLHDTHVDLFVCSLCANGVGDAAQSLVDALRVNSSVTSLSLASWWRGKSDVDARVAKTCTRLLRINRALPSVVPLAVMARCRKTTAVVRL
jgi:hypothetical protein